MKTFKFFTFLLALGVIFSSCKKDDDKEVSASMSNVNIQVKAPKSIQVLNMDGLNLVVENIHTGSLNAANLNSDGTHKFTVKEGMYNISVSGKIKVIVANGEKSVEKELNLKAAKENYAIKGESVNLILEGKVSQLSGGWLFKEIYFKGSEKPSGKAYIHDNYFILVNNSSELMYADGLSISEADHSTVLSENKWAKDIEKHVVVQTIYTIPGGGKDYPIKPGGSVILVDKAMDHTVENPNSVNLTNAHFEWYDNHKLDIDVPEVPNLIKHFSYSESIWIPHSRGYKSYILFYAENMENFLSKNKFNETTPFGKIITSYKVPNELILDAVELSVPELFKSKALSMSLDKSFTYSNMPGKSVCRLVEINLGDRVVYKDSNDSNADFIPNAELSMKY
ncbi:MAG: DUF4876 domain-containing protein [Bacteroidales bacterium]